MKQVTFFRLLQAEDKSSALRTDIANLRSGRCNSDVFFANITAIKSVPGCPFAYWISAKIRKQYLTCKPLDPTHGQAVRGITTCDDFRFIRLFWEVNPSELGRSRNWAPLAKGGDFSPFHSDIATVVYWKNEGHELRTLVDEHGREKARFRGEKNFYRVGLTYPNRNTKGFNTRILPADCVISHVGQSIFPNDPKDLYSLLAITNSRAFEFFLRIITSHRHWEVGVIQKTPIPDLSTAGKEGIAIQARRYLEVVRSFDLADETTHLFVYPEILQTQAESLAERIQKCVQQAIDSNNTMKTYQRQIDETVFSAYEFNDYDREIVSAEFQATSGTIASSEDHPEFNEEFGAASFLSHANHVSALISYSVGLINGRWDVRFVTKEAAFPELPDPISPFSPFQLGALQEPDGLPATETPESYPLRIDWDGILVDDPKHQDDIVRQVRAVLELIWKNRAESIEKEACDILGIKTLRDFFRKPVKGGFWDDHVKRYSKSRRKAPIYWLLQSSKKNYALWLYYHRLDKDMLFKALLNYVEPKIQREENRLGELRSQKSSAGDSGKEAKKLDRGMEKQEDLLSELRDFEEKLRKVADLHLVPDLNDGVVLNIAPLHELVPWKEAKKYWDHLMDGKYEWSSIGKQLREKGLVQD